MIAVCLCESQPVVIEGLRRSLQDADDLHFASAVSTPMQTLEMLERDRPRVCLLDQAFGFRAVLEIIAEIKKRRCGVEPVVWAAEISEVEAFRALQAGARGILKKTAPLNVVLACLRAVANGNTWIESSISNQLTAFANRPSTHRFTRREDEILKLVMRGMSNKDIADVLGITVGTVKVHLMHIFDKAGVNDRLELALFGQKIRELSADSKDEPPA